MLKNEIVLNCNSPEKITETAKNIIKFGTDKKVWLFEGELGAGKTTFIKKICEIWQVQDNVTSPSFALINEYRNHKNEAVYHFDFYRLENEEEALDIGIEEYFDSGYLCLVEWPSKIKGIIPENHLMIRIVINADKSRSIYLSNHE